MSMNIKSLSLILILCLSFSQALFAEEEELAQEELDTDPVEYIELEDSIVTNYMNEKLSFVKADVALKVRGKAFSAVSPHTPRIKHILIHLLSQQPFDIVGTPEGQVILKQLALDEINLALGEEDKDAYVEEVLFTGMLVE